LIDGENIVHYSYLVPKCYKFPFLGREDYEIGPCVTNDSYRRKGSYAYMLEHITKDIKFEKSCFYMIVSDDNLPSIKGIEKAGFLRCGNLIKTKFLKIYRKEK